jgi:ABC-type cobalamin/Fe3+-siderophores transport system ATPase subunit
MRIVSLKLENYRGFREATIDFDRPLTVLVGVNGSGKSSVLTAIATLCSEIVRSAYRGDFVGWFFEDVDIRADAPALRVTTTVTNGDIGSPVEIRTDHRRGDRVTLGALSDFGPKSLGMSKVFRAAPVLPIFYVAARTVAHGSRAFAQPDNVATQAAPLALLDALDPTRPAGREFGSLFRWFKEREDVENEARVSNRDLEREDPQLGAVRRAVAGLLPGYFGLRVQRDPLHLIIRKRDGALALDQLSDGEKMLLAMTADLARRLALTYPDRTDPLGGEAIVLIDEIELHLHVGWQRTALPNLQSTFPGCQFIVTTHSPQVLSSVAQEAVVILDDFAVVHASAPTKGRDSNAILREVFGLDERPNEVLDEVRKVGAMLDDGNVDAARLAITSLEQQLGWQDDEVIRLKTRLDFLDAPLAADHA